MTPGRRSARAASLDRAARRAVAAAAARKLPISMWSGPDRVRRAVQRGHALDAQVVGAEPLDARAHLVQQRAEVLDVRLAGGVEDRGAPSASDRGHEDVLRGGDAGLVEQEVARPRRLLAAEA